MKVFKQLKRYSKKQNGFHKLICTQIWARPILGSHNELPSIRLYESDDFGGNEYQYEINFNKNDINTLQQIIAQLEKLS